MEVNEALIDKLSHLARLEFNAKEKVSIQNDLSRMIGFVDKISELELEGVEPLMHLSGETNRFREDTPGDELSQEKALSNAAHNDGQFFKVPKVIRK